jgi:hypothetical protein
MNKTCYLLQKSNSDFSASHPLCNSLCWTIAAPSPEQFNSIFLLLVIPFQSSVQGNILYLITHRIIPLVDIPSLNNLQEQTTCSWTVVRSLYSSWTVLCSLYRPHTELQSEVRPSTSVAHCKTDVKVFEPQVYCSKFKTPLTLLHIVIPQVTQEWRQFGKITTLNGITSTAVLPTEKDFYHFHILFTFITRLPPTNDAGDHCRR